MGIIEVKNLSKSYEDGKNSSVIFKDINLDVEAGKFVAIIGKADQEKVHF